MDPTFFVSSACRKQHVDGGIELGPTTAATVDAKCLTPSNNTHYPPEAVDSVSAATNHSRTVEAGYITWLTTTDLVQDTDTRIEALTRAFSSLESYTLARTQNTLTSLASS